MGLHLVVLRTYSWLLTQASLTGVIQIGRIQGIHPSHWTLSPDNRIVYCSGFSESDLRWCWWIRWATVVVLRKLNPYRNWAIPSKASLCFSESQEQEEWLWSRTAFLASPPNSELRSFPGLLPSSWVQGKEQFRGSKNLLPHVWSRWKFPPSLSLSTKFPGQRIYMVELYFALNMPQSWPCGQTTGHSVLQPLGIAPATCLQRYSDIVRGHTS